MLLGDVPMHARWQRLERFWIAELLDTGHPLLNSKRGGEGTDSDMAKATWAKPDAEFNRLVALSDPEVRAKMSAAQKEINSRPGVREHKSVASKKANSTPEKKKLFAAQSSERLKNNEEHVRAMRAGNKALWSDPKRKEQIVGKMRSAVQEAWSDPIKSAQRRAKIAAAWAAKRAATTT